MENVATEKGKEFALAELKKRQENPPEKRNNSSLPAGSPMYFYCRVCDHESDVLPESFVGQPKRLCKECEALEQQGWLDK